MENGKTVGMPRLRQVSRHDTTDQLVLQMYDFLFGDRDPVVEEEPLGAFSDLDRAAAGELSRALGSREFTGRAFDLLSRVAASLDLDPVDSVPQFGGDGYVSVAPERMAEMVEMSNVTLDEDQAIAELVQRNLDAGIYRNTIRQSDISNELNPITISTCGNIGNSNTSYWQDKHHQKQH